LDLSLNFPPKIPTTALSSFFAHYKNKGMSFFKGGKFFGKKYHLIQKKYLQKENFCQFFMKIFEKIKKTKPKNKMRRKYKK
jgi:hypothetical protein